ncbi:transcription factor S [Candidatus Pacearchaeota archaeon]|nr:transcription factor S [Candidatus Pacearchaeota archaeon]
MKFCPKCGAVLVQKTKNYGCPRCNYSTKEKVKINTSEKIGEKKQVVVMKGIENQTLPIIAETCKKCKNKEAYFWTIQTRAGDEAETKFFKCTNPKCNYTWRDYS